MKREMIRVVVPADVAGFFCDLTRSDNEDDVATKDDVSSCEKPAEAECDASSVSSPNKGKKK